VLAGLTMLAGGSALADGMSRGSIKDAPVATPSWSGFYLGAGVGYGHMLGDNKYSDDFGPGTFQSWTNDSAGGGFGTVVIGFDRLVRERYVVGLFADADWGSIEGHFRNSDPPATDDSFRIRNAYSVGARAGFLMTPTSLLFATAGYSWAKIKSNGYFDVVNSADPDDIVLGKRSVSLQGPFVGIGMETQLGRNWSLRGEARYTMFNEVTTASGQFLDDTIFVDKLDANLLTARLAVIYKFNRDEAPVAPIK